MKQQRNLQYSRQIYSADLPSMLFDIFYYSMTTVASIYGIVAGHKYLTNNRKKTAENIIANRKQIELSWDATTSSKNNLVQGQKGSLIGGMGKKPISPILVKSLNRMWNQDGDSVGIATRCDDKILLKKGAGTINNVNEALKLDKMPGFSGIGHIRHATHGRVNATNAHPHNTPSNFCSVVHTGIIENYQEIKKEVEQKGICFKSETDSEVIPNLLNMNWVRTGDIKEMILKTVSKLKGSYNFIAMVQKDNLIAVRNNEEMFVGIGRNEFFVANSILGLEDKVEELIYLKKGQFVIINESKLKIFNSEGRQVSKYPRCCKKE